MDKKTAGKLLAQTRKNYDSFAESFSRTREYVSEEILQLLNAFVKRGNRVIDIGCGNGRLYPIFQNLDAGYAGVDGSKNLIKIAADKYPNANFTIGDALDLPFIADEFDLAVSLAVLHHIPSKEYRLKFFQEAYRVLKPQGIFILTVWDLRASTMIKQKQWKRLKSFLKSQIKIALKTEKLDFGDFFIPWQNKYPRYHHAFSLRELKNLAESAGFIVERSGAFGVGKREANLYIIAKKV